MAAVSDLVETDPAELDDDGSPFPRTIFHDRLFWFDRVGGTGEAIYRRTDESGLVKHVLLIDEERAAAAEARRRRLR